MYCNLKTIWNSTIILKLLCFGHGGFKQIHGFYCESSNVYNLISSVAFAAVNSDNKKIVLY